MKKILSDELLNDFAKSFFIKEAQDAPIDPQLAIKLVDNLIREVSGEAAPIEIESPNEGVQLKIANLESIDKLLKFLSDNKIMVNGEIIVYSSDEYNRISPYKPGYYPVPARVGRESDTTGKPVGTDRRANVDDYFTNLKLLGEYVKYLQNKAVAGKKAKDPESDVFMVMIGKLVDQINDHVDTGKRLDLQRAQEKSTPDKPANKTNESNDEEVVAMMPSTFDFKTPIEQIGDKELKIKHIKSREAFNSWLSYGNKAIIAMYDDKGGRKEVYWTAPNADKCIIMQILFNKAKYLYDKAEDQDQSKLARDFMDKIKTLSSQYDYNGIACSILGAGQSIKQIVQPSNTQPGKTQSGTDDASKQLDKSKMVALRDILYNFPLEPDTLNIARIERFLPKAANLFEGNDTQNVNGRFNDFQSQLNTSIDSMKALLAPGYNQSALGLDSPAQAVLTWLNKPGAPQDSPYRNYKTLVELMNKVIYFSYQIVFLIKDTYEDVLSGDLGAPIREKIRQQENNYQRNVSLLRTMYNSAPRVK